MKYILFMSLITLPLWPSAANKKYDKETLKALQPPVVTMVSKSKMPPPPKPSRRRLRANTPNRKKKDESMLPPTFVLKFVPYKDEKDKGK